MRRLFACGYILVGLACSQTPAENPADGQAPPDEQEAPITQGDPPTNASSDGGKGTGTGGGEREGGAPPADDQGQGDGNDVVALGDSYMRLPNAFQQPGTEGVDLSLMKISG